MQKDYFQYPVSQAVACQSLPTSAMVHVTPIRPITHRNVTSITETAARKRVISKAPMHAVKTRKDMALLAITVLTPITRKSTQKFATSSIALGSEMDDVIQKTIFRSVTMMPVIVVRKLATQDTLTLNAEMKTSHTTARILITLNQS